MATLKTGVYRIRHIDSDRCYIGSTATSFSRRWSEHRRDLNNQRHHCSRLQNAWNKYGADAFVFEVLLYCDPEDCVTFEQMAIDSYEPEYNICLVAGNSLGYRHTKEAIEKIKANSIGENNHFFGKRHSKDTKSKISKSRQGRFSGANNPFYGKKHTDRSRETMSLNAPDRSGESHPRATITINVAKQIKTLIQKGNMSKDIAKQLNTTLHVVQNIRRGKTWKNA